MSKFLPNIMIVCLISTIIIELIIAIILKIKGKDLINVILVNIMTNPIVVTIPYYLNVNYGLIYRNISLFILEILTVISEGYIYKKYLDFKEINPYLLALILNISSYTIGIIINYIIY